MNFRNEWSRLPVAYKDLIERHQASIPVKLSALAKDLGLRIVASTLPTGISGEIRPTDSGYTISVNRHDSPYRQRFTVAHEIAHFLLHRDQIGSGITDDVLYRSSLSDSREAEANRLAAEIIFPHAKLMELVNVDRNGVSDDDFIKMLSSKFEVSEIAMKIRLGLA